jgi:hypothetical protein
LAFADIDCLFSPNQGITLPIKKEELKYLAVFYSYIQARSFFLSLLHTNKKFFYSFAEDKRDKNVFLKPKIASHC